MSNPLDPNTNIPWDFCELTWNSSELFANISYVDFVSLPVALNLPNTSGAQQAVTGMPANGPSTVISGLQAQQASDNAGWSSLVVTDSSGAILRALSPNNGIALNNSLFQDYWTSYLQAVFAQYSGSTTLSIDTQAQWGVVAGSVDSRQPQLRHRWQRRFSLDLRPARRG